MDALRQAGELENTLVIFTSDNGFFHGEHRIWSGKAQVYEPGIRVPLLMRGPGSRRDAGRTGSSATSTSRRRSSRRPASRRGLSSTDARCCRSPAEPVPRWRDYLLLEGGDRLGLDYDGIRTPRYVYAEHRAGPRELYDLRLDPFQLQSVHKSPAYAAVRAELEARLANLRICAGAAAASAAGGPPAAQHRRLVCRAHEGDPDCRAERAHAARCARSSCPTPSRPIS